MLYRSVIACCIEVSWRVVI